MSTWDVIVVGLGGVGSSAAFHLASRGHRVLGLEQFSAGHCYGSSHGKTRVIRQAYFEHVSYVPLLRRAYELWGELEQAVGQQLFHRTGLVEIGPTDGVVVPGVLQSASEHQLDVEQLSPIDVRRRWPGLEIRDDWQAVLERNAGYLRVEACVKAYLSQAEQASATLRYGQTVRRWRSVGSGVEVITDAGTERAAGLVFAGGAWSGQLLGQFGMPLRVLRKHQYWYAPTSPGYRQCDGFPCFFHETPEGYFYGFPSIDGSGVKVARHSGGTPIDCPTPTHPSDPHDQQLVEHYLREYLPGVGNRLLHQAGCYYTVTPDEHFVVDVHPQFNQIAVVAGLSGHGFKFASVLGELASQFVSQQPRSMDTTLLRIQR